MKRRLYYLIPDSSKAKQLVDDLEATAVPKQDVHTVTKDQLDLNKMDNLHTASVNDRDYFVEWFLWRSNLALFFVALAVFIAMLIWYPGIWLILPLVIMIGSFVSGLLFVLRMPNVHLNEFTPALQHGEVLLMVDIPVSEINRVDQQIHRSHPEVVTGGVCWHV